MTVAARKKIAAFSVLASLGLPALAQESLVLEEVIVTAQKRTESLAETPMTVSVVTSEQIAEFGAFTISDINNMTTGLSIIGGGVDWDFSVRGVSADINAPIVPRMSFYVDGSYFQQPRGLLTGLFDLAQIEVLRGPQGTLYGQTSPAGAVTIRSNNPNLEEFDGYVRQSFNDQSGSNTQLAVSIPIIKDKLGVRIAGLYDTNENSDIENTTLNRDLENETTAYRAVVLWEPTENFDLRLVYLDIEDENDIDPMVEGNGLDVDDRTAVADQASYFKNETTMFALESNYRFANDWVATLAISDQENLIPRDYDEDASEVLASNVFLGGGVPDIQTYEFRLASHGNEFWDWMVGGFYMDTDSLTEVDVDTFIADPLPLYIHTVSDADLESKQSAIFTHNSFHVTQNGTLTVGLRYTDYERDSRQPFTFEYYLRLPDGSIGPFLGGEEVEGVPPKDQSGEEDAVTGTLRYQHRLTDDFMAYAAYDRGWVPGSVNIAARPLPPEFGAFDAEETDNLEIGFKWEVMNGRGLWNLALYYQVYTDFMYNAEQFDTRNVDGGISVSTAVVNIDEAESYGFDTDFTVLLSQNWTLRAGLSYNKAELTDAKDVPCTSGEPVGEEVWSYNTCDFTGDRAGAAPEWSANLSSEYFNDLGDSMQWYVRGLFNAESEYYSISERKDLDSYAMLDLYLGLRSSSDTWDANIWVKNVTDESAVLKTETRGELPDYDAGAQVANPYIWIRRSLDPRTIGVTVSYNF
jgi:iron complex outermembrane receptor protein